MTKLTKEQAIVITGYTGITACNFGDFHGDVEKRLGHPVWVHQFGDKQFMEKIQELYRADFMEMVTQ
jgi:hypothetical protein